MQSSRHYILCNLIINVSLWNVDRSTFYLFFPLLKNLTFFYFLFVAVIRALV